MTFYVGVQNSLMKEQYHFTDYYQNDVTLSFADHPFSKKPKHVLTICNYRGKWLLTKHKSRGLEFPGGNVEKGETAREAAVREVLEETGGMIEDIHYIGQYFVDGKREQIIKNVYFAYIERIEEQPTYYETEGPVLIDRLPKDIDTHHEYSFIMKDGVTKRSLEYIEEKFRLSYNKRDT